jgi:hypothetical protein
MAQELAPLAKRLSAARRLPGSRGVEGRLSGATLRLVATGPGRRRARAGIRDLLAELADASSGDEAPGARGQSVGGARWERLVLVGVAGGLDPRLERGDVVRVGRVVRLAGAVEAAAEHRLAGGEQGTALTVDRIVAEAAEKQELWSRLGRPTDAVVDMETFHWVSALLDAAAETAQSPAPSVLRAVSDPAAVSLPSYLPWCVGAGGEISRARVAMRSLARPGSMGDLLRLRRDVGAAAQRLADAVEDLVAGGDRR